MPHRSIEQLRELEARTTERLAKLRTEIREREAKEMSRLAASYAKTIKPAAKETGGKLPSPAELAAMLTQPKPAKRRPARRGRKVT